MGGREGMKVRYKILQKVTEWGSNGNIVYVVDEKQDFCCNKLEKMMEDYGYHFELEGSGYDILPDKIHIVENNTEGSKEIPDIDVCPYCGINFDWDLIGMEKEVLKVKRKKIVSYREKKQVQVVKVKSKKELKGY